MTDQTSDATTSPQPVESPGCDCESGDTGGLSRRGFLSGLSGLAALGAATTVGGLSGSLLSTRMAFAADGSYTGDTLVVLSLRGGFDGLSAIVPNGDPNYLKARPGIGVLPGATLRLDPMFGMHPAMAKLKPFWDSGKLAAVHAVGQVNPSRSHFAAMEELERAAPGSSIRTGWLDRALGLTGAGTPFAGTLVGSSFPTTQWYGPRPILSFVKVNDLKLTSARTTTEATRWRRALTALHANAPQVVAQPVDTLLGALRTGETLRSTSYAPANGAVYPSGDLGAALRDIARLIKSGVGLRVASVDFGNWDMHVNLGQPNQGRMATQLHELSAAMAAFATDLGSRMSGVTLVALSEFGRRVAQNASHGLDHGHGNAMLLLGGGIRGGQVYGRWPSLAPSALDNGDLAGTTDYRVVLAEVLEKRCGVSTSTVFPNAPSTRLGLAAQR